MKVLAHPLFLFCCFLAGFVYIANLYQLPLSNWVTFYVNDFLCMPIILSICLFGVRQIKGNSKLYIPGIAIVSLCIYFAVFFEWIMPRINPRYTADWIDIMLYGIGGLLFFIFQKRVYGFTI